MKVLIEPPMSAWQPRQREGGPIIATGHQAGFWHPGILAKCIAAVNFAKKVRGRAVYVLVDQDDNDSCRLELPVVEAGRLQVKSIELEASIPGVALRTQPRMDWGTMIHNLRSAADHLAVDVSPLLGALQKLATSTEANPAAAPTRADQWALLLRTLWQPVIGELEIVHATSLLDEAIIDRMLRDASACVAHYNEAVAASPQAGMLPLVVERDRVELPLWKIGDASSPMLRQRVFADLSDSDPWLVTADGEPVRREANRYLGLAPRALLLTALMRSKLCDLFIHGHGGGIYDRVMQQWWHAWTGDALAPMAVVSADLRLPFHDVFQASPQDLARAIWFAHHLPHNIDRYLPAPLLDASLVQRKHELLDHMNDDRDHDRRQRSFREIHAINDRFVKAHADVIALAHQELERLRTGIANRAIAQKRDWSFTFYDAAALRSLNLLLTASADWRPSAAAPSI